MIKIIYLLGLVAGVVICAMYAFKAYMGIEVSATTALIPWLVALIHELQRWEDYK